jgi:hypothetical protein
MLWFCQRVTLSSFSVPARETGWEERTMKELVLPVPETVSATYIVPVPAPISTVEARRQAGKAVEARLTGPLRTLTTRWLAQAAVRVKAEPAGPPPPGLLDKPLFGTQEQRVFLARARAFVQFRATQRTSLIGMQEWKARGPAAALAAGLGAPVLDPRTPQVLTAEEALAALPDTALTIQDQASRRLGHLGRRQGRHRGRPDRRRRPPSLVATGVGECPQAAANRMRPRAATPRAGDAVQRHRL